MPPVLGPRSPSKTRLKSCAGCSGTTVSPSVRQNSETSGPSRNSSTTTRPPAFDRHSRACSSASVRSSVTTTPLPAARPSSFTTYGAPNWSNATSTSSRLSHTCAIAVGTPALAMTSFANALLPSSRAAAPLGPKVANPAARRWSATPSTSGPSGPTTTRSTPSCAASSAAAAGSVEVERVDLRLRGDPRVAGRRVQLLDVGVRGESADQSVLTSTRTEHQDLHAREPTRAGTAPDRRPPRSRLADANEPLKRP